MRLTKYEHACFTIEKGGQLLVIDPGNFTTDFAIPSNVIGIIITHAHSDHFDPDQLTAIYNNNPDSILIAHPSIVEKMPDHKSISVQADDTITLGHFNLAFFGGEHATIHPDMPPLANLGVLIDSRLYYPGDSFVRPMVPVDTLALPVGAPWLKISETIDFLREVHPRFAFPTHDAVLSDIGKSLPDRMIPQLVPDVTYKRLTAPIDL